MRRFSYLLFLICLFSIIPLSQAQSSTWTAWLYDHTEGRLLQVDSTGAALWNIQLPTVMAHDNYSRSVAVSPDGQRVAYSVNSSSQMTHQFFIADLQDFMAPSPTEPGPSVVYSPPQPQLADSFVFDRSLVWNDDGATVAYGYGLDPEGWEIVVLDAETGSVMFELTSQSPQMQAIRIEDFFLVPAIHRYSGGALDFSLINWATEGRPEYENYQWNLVTNTVTPSVAYPSPSADTLLTTGEVVTPFSDDRFPDQDEFLMMGWQMNTLHVYDPVTQARWPFFARADWGLGSVHFVNNGAYVLTRFGVMSTDEIQWALIDRNGALVGQPILPTDYQTSIAGIPSGYLVQGVELRADGGYLYIDQADAPNLMSPYRVYTASSPTENYRFAWVSAMGGGNFVYGNWAQLADPTVAAMASGAPPFEGGPFIGDPPIPTATPIIASGTLTVGGIAYTQTTEGDSLNVRSGPGLSFQRVGQVASGVRLELLEGPRPADGYTWWRVRLPDNREGWVVQRADNVDTLIPSN